MVVFVISRALRESRWHTMTAEDCAGRWLGTATAPEADEAPQQQRRWNIPRPKQREKAEAHHLRVFVLSRSRSPPCCSLRLHHRTAPLVSRLGPAFFTRLSLSLSTAMNNLVATLLVALIAVLALLVDGAAAFDAGDGICLALGLIVAFILFCAALGWWARRESGV